MNTAIKVSDILVHASDYNLAQIESVINGYNGDLQNVLTENARRILRLRTQEDRAEMIEFYCNELMADIRPGDWNWTLNEDDVKNIFMAMQTAAIQ